MCPKCGSIEIRYFWQSQIKENRKCLNCNTIFLCCKDKDNE